jgi:translation initiation factor 3 subunit I
MILTDHESGKVALVDVNADTGEEVLSNEWAHMDVVTDLQLSADRSCTLAVFKTFRTETPLSSAALAPNMPYMRVLFPVYLGF